MRFGTPGWQDDSDRPETRWRMLLSDRQLIALIDDDPEFIRGLDASTHERRVQASSVDLTVGKIYMPETPHGEPGPPSHWC